jgi:predicted acetyltransferase
VHLGVYRRFGWETAFACQRRRLPLEAAVIGPLDVAPGGYRVMPWGDEDLGDIAEFYTGVAGRQNGPFDRTVKWWHERVLAPVNQREVYRYVARSADGIGAYLVYSHEPAGANLPYGFELDCRDFFWSNPAAAEAILAFVRGHAGMGHGFRWIGPVADPLELRLRGVAPSVEKRLIAMCRLVDVGRALEARGYPDGLAASVRLRVRDDVVPENDGVIDVTFDGGRAQVEPGRDDGALDVDVRTLAAMFTGFIDPFAAADTGLLSGADPVVLHTLRTAFGGSPPWMAGFF